MTSLESSQVQLAISVIRQIDQLTDEQKIHWKKEEGRSVVCFGAGLDYYGIHFWLGFGEDDLSLRISMPSHFAQGGPYGGFIAVILTGHRELSGLLNKLLDKFSGPSQVNILHAKDPNIKGVLPELSKLLQEIQAE